MEGGGYCLPCVTFYTRRASVQAGVLVSYALTNFKHAIENLKKHEQNNYPKEAVVKRNHLWRWRVGSRTAFSSRSIMQLPRSLLPGTERRFNQSLTLSTCARVTVVILCVCLSVCCRASCYIPPHLYTESWVPLGFLCCSQHICCVDFVEYALFKNSVRFADHLCLLHFLMNSQWTKETVMASFRED